MHKHAATNPTSRIPFPQNHISILSMRLIIIILAEIPHSHGNQKRQTASCEIASDPSSSDMHQTHPRPSCWSEVDVFR